MYLSKKLTNSFPTFKMMAVHFDIPVKFMTVNVLIQAMHYLLVSACGCDNILLDFLDQFQ